jgi:cytochrome c oxidase cbb3-type subunit 2
MRLQDPNWHHLHLYNPRITTPPTASGIAGSIMPPFPFLYETRKIVGEPSRKALRLTGEHAPPPGYEVIPTARAEALVAYLLSLKTDYSLPESPIREP